MGMYDTIINHYDIGPGFNRKKLQTKTIYNTPTMSVYWLDPAGQFWVLNCDCLLYTSPSPRDYAASRMPSSA